MSATVQAGMPWSEIAESAYKAYAAVTGNKNFCGEEMPKFDDLPLIIRTAWEAAVRQAGRCLKLQGDATPPDEVVWNGWLSPSYHTIT